MYIINMCCKAMLGYHHPYHQSFISIYNLELFLIILHIALETISL